MTEPAKPVRGRPIKKGQKLNQRTGMTDKRRRFVAEYLKDLNQTAAAIRAGFSERTAKQTGYELMRDPLVQAAVQAEMAKRAERTKIDGDAVLRNIQRIAERAEQAKKYGDALRGQELLGKHLKLFTDNVELTGANGGPVQIIKRVIVAPK